MSFSEYPVLRAFLAGAVSGTFSTVIFQPLDLVKTRLQTPIIPKTIGTMSGSNSIGMLPIINHILQQEQVFGLWKGMTPSLVRCIPGVGLYFSVLHVFKSKYVSGDGKNLNPTEAILLGAGARSVSGACMIPFTVLKTRYESGVYQYTGINHALKAIYKTEGARGLMCGLAPTLFRDAPFSGLYLMFYTQTKQALPEAWFDGSTAAPVNFTCGVAAGVLASVVTQPADVIKTNMQLYPEQFKNSFTAIYYIHKKYGYTGYFKGLVPRMLRRTLVAAMAWTVYEQITRSIGLK